MKLVALAGGVGGARLADGLARILPPTDLTIIVNTGDDFEHLGLRISPDLDTVCYTLAGIANTETGWGLKDESWNAIKSLTLLGGPDWFRLGDRDLGTHLERTRRLSAGDTLSQITADFCHAWNVKHKILPMSDQAVATMVDTVEHGEIPFQDYFVRLRCEPGVRGFRFSGIQNALPAHEVIESIQMADAVVICPSNPWVSIDPILAVPGIRDAISQKVVTAVSPIIGGKTIKGPAAKMFQELGISPSATAVARHYQGLLDGFILDRTDHQLVREVEELGIRTIATDTIMTGIEQRVSLGKDVLNLIQEILNEHP